MCKNSQNYRWFSSISLKFLTDFDDLTLDVPRTLKFSRSEVKVTAWHNVLASNNAIIQTRVSCQKSNLVKIIQMPSTTRNAMFKVIKSNTEIAITLPRMARLRSYLGWYRVSSRHRWYATNVEGQRSRSQRKCNVLEAKNAIIWQWVGSVTSNLAWHRK